MKKSLLAISLASLLAAPSAFAGFINGGFEDGDLNGWTGGGGSWSGGGYPVDPSIYAGGTPNNTVVSAGIDSITGASTVYAGDYSVRVNDSINNYSVSTLTQTVTNYTDDSIFFAWNAVLEASHGETDSDYFSLTLVDDTTNSVLVSLQYSSASTPDSFTALNNGWYTSGWVVEQIDLLALGAVGHDFTLTLMASDCPYGGHAGYVYLDGFGSQLPPPGNDVPAPASLGLLGLGLAALAAHRRSKV